MFLRCYSFNILLHFSFICFLAFNMAKPPDTLHSHHDILASTCHCASPHHLSFFHSCSVIPILVSLLYNSVGTNTALYTAKRAAVLIFCHLNNVAKALLTLLQKAIDLFTSISVNILLRYITSFVGSNILPLIFHSVVLHFFQISEVFILTFRLVPLFSHFPFRVVTNATSHPL